MAADTAKKKINLHFGLSNDKVKAMAGETLASGGLPLVVQQAAHAFQPRKRPGRLSGAFNAAAGDAVMRPPSTGPSPRM